MTLWIICILLLAGGAACGLLWVLLSTFSEGARTATGVYEHEITNTLESMFLFVPARKLVDLGLVSAIFMFLLVLVPFCRLSPLWLPFVGCCLAFPPAILAFYLPKFIVHHLKNKRIERFNLQLLEALPMMSNALRAGFSINQAFESVAESSEVPMKQEISLLLQQLRVGVPFSEALSNLEMRVGSDDLTLVCSSIDIARKSGGNLTEIFDTISETIRARLRIHQHGQLLASGQEVPEDEEPQVDMSGFVATEEMLQAEAAADVAYVAMGQELKKLYSVLDDAALESLQETMEGIVYQLGDTYDTQYDRYLELTGEKSTTTGFLIRHGDDLIYAGIALLVVAALVVFYELLVEKLGIPRVIIGLFFILLCFMCLWYDLALSTLLSNTVVRMGMNYGAIITIQVNTKI